MMMKDKDMPMGDHVKDATPEQMKKMMHGDMTPEHKAQMAKLKANMEKAKNSQHG